MLSISERMGDIHFQSSAEYLCSAASLVDVDMIAAYSRSQKGGMCGMAFSYGKEFPRVIGEARVRSAQIRKSQSDMIVEVCVHYRNYLERRRVKGVRLRLQSTRTLTFGDCRQSDDIIVSRVTEVCYTVYLRIWLMTLIRRNHCSFGDFLKLIQSSN
jgi:hypothetical protein